jgi:hypothetical protein
VATSFKRRVTVVIGIEFDRNERDLLLDAMRDKGKKLRNRVREITVFLEELRKCDIVHGFEQNQAERGKEYAEARVIIWEALNEKIIKSIERGG